MNNICESCSLLSHQGELETSPQILYNCVITDVSLKNLHSFPLNPCFSVWVTRAWGLSSAFWKNYEAHLFSGWGTAGNLSVLWGSNTRGAFLQWLRAVHQLFPWLSWLLVAAEDTCQAQAHFSDRRFFSILNVVWINACWIQLKYVTTYSSIL